MQGCYTRGKHLVCSSPYCLKQEETFLHVYGTNKMSRGLLTKSETLQTTAHRVKPQNSVMRWSILNRQTCECDNLPIWNSFHLKPGYRQLWPFIHQFCCYLQHFVRNDSVCSFMVNTVLTVSTCFRALTIMEWAALPCNSQKFNFITAFSVNIPPVSTTESSLLQMRPVFLLISSYLLKWLVIVSKRSPVTSHRQSWRTW